MAIEQLIAGGYESRARCRDPEPGIWGQRLEDQRAYLLRLASVKLPRQLRGKLGADDIVQETVLRALRYGRTYRGRNRYHLRGWLRRILLSRISEWSAFYQAQRRDVRRERNLIPFDSQSLAEPYPSSAASTPDDQLIHAESMQLLATAIDALPEKYRFALELRYLDGLALAQITQRTGWSQDQAQKYLQRGRVKLRWLLVTRRASPLE